MTNVSKNMLFAFLVAVSATVLSLGAFATTVHADDYGFGVDGGGYSDFSSYGGGYSDFSSYGGGYDDYSTYGGGYSDFSSYGGGYDDYSTYGGGYSDFSSYGGGYNDFSSYGGGYSDFSQYSDSYNPGYIATDSYNPGYYETDSYNPGYYATDSYNPGYYATDSYNPGYYATDSYVAEYMDSYAAGNPILGGFSGGSFGGGSSFGGGGFSMPKFGSTGGCTTCHTQTYTPPRTTPGCTNCNPPRPNPTCTTCGGSNVTNTNINTNTNTWIDNSIVDNSINGSFNTNISNSGNTSITTVTPVPVQPIIQYQQQIAAPYCVITLQNAGAYTAQATLVWSSSNAQSAYITSIGNVAPNGTRVVTGFANQTYSLTVTGQGGSYTCHTQYTPTYVPPAPITPSVSLTQIPYTGLALGPVAQALYWLSLFSVAAAGAYLLVYFKGGALAAVGASMNRRQNHFVVSEQETEEVSAPEVTVEEVEEVAAPAASLNFLPTMASGQTRDIMSVIRSIDGAPRIVINRA
ncbi:MAG: hypothetical protein KBD06_01730 [Candidatus Pacebacteria bacterium]|nr:hypothetical protein [Candidatus Paceibacterota bacterium]